MLQSATATPTSPDGDDASIQLSQMFRASLEALSRPGTPRPLAFDAAPAPLSPAAAALIWTVSDADAPIWVAPSRQSTEIEQFIRFRTGVAPLAAPEGAAFFIGRWDELAESPMSLGSPEYPDRSTTLIIEVDGFAAGLGASLSGPGLAQPAPLSVDGVDYRFWPFVERNAALFPLGVDMFLCASDQIVGLPRSTQPDAFSSSEAR
ncbi:MAG: phosphonate C-P lyase system protein PhnH [Rhodobacteraceae bacterium]|nr:phosphonate C-P lyase system protein PhnH [Paracoccaceae bacterium]